MSLIIRHIRIQLGEARYSFFHRNTDWSKHAFFRTVAARVCYNYSILVNVHRHSKCALNYARYLPCTFTNSYRSNSAHTSTSTYHAAEKPTALSKDYIHGSSATALQVKLTDAQIENQSAGFSYS